MLLHLYKILWKNLKKVLKAPSIKYNLKLSVSLNISDHLEN